MEWTNVHSCLCDAVLTIANFVNTMETIGGGKLLRRHMNGCSYVRIRHSVFLIGRVVSRSVTTVVVTRRVPDLNEFAICVGQ